MSCRLTTAEFRVTATSRETPPSRRRGIASAACPSYAPPERGGAIAFWERLAFAPCEPYRDYPFAMAFMERRLEHGDVTLP